MQRHNDSEPKGSIRHDWSRAEVQALFGLPFMDLLLRAQALHRAHHEPNTVQMSTLLSIKTGACPEDCAYCPQSVRYETGLDREELMNVAAVRDSAMRAKQAGATRFCMGAAYRSPKPKDLAVIAQMIREVRALGLESCATLGMLTPAQALELKAAGLDYYNHNLDTSAQFYGEIITTRSYQDRLDGCADVDPFDFVRTIAVARLLMPRAHVRLSAGRDEMSDELQALCFLAGANSIFYGEKLLTTGNPDVAADRNLFARLGLNPEALKGTAAADAAHGAAMAAGPVTATAAAR
jgi:biotin synthase